MGTQNLQSRHPFRLVEQFPFISYGLLMLALGIGIQLLERLGSGYDDGGIGTMAFISSLIWNVLAFPYYVSSELLFTLNEGHAISAHSLVAYVIGLTAFFVAEIGHQLWRRQSAGAA